VVVNTAIFLIIEYDLMTEKGTTREEEEGEGGEEELMQVR
jgi:hypothetical protein